MRGPTRGHSRHLAMAQGAHHPPSNVSVSQGRHAACSLPKAIWLPRTPHPAGTRYSLGRGRSCPASFRPCPGPSHTLLPSGASLISPGDPETPTVWKGPGAQSPEEAGCRPRLSPPSRALSGLSVFPSMRWAALTALMLAGDGGRAGSIRPPRGRHTPAIGLSSGPSVSTCLRVLGSQQEPMLKCP